MKKSADTCSPKLNINQQTEAWQQVNWKACQRHVDRLQRSISVATEYFNWKKVKQLRRILYKSEAFNLLCTRKVTQDNQGKKTAGVDKVKSLTPAQRYRTVLSMKDGIERHWNPVRQVEIPKKNGKIRTLGIPTIKDRIYQAKLKGIVEPSYETIAEQNSYGFRPMRSTKDAIAQIFNAVKKKEEAWILEGDLKGFFDNIKTSAITSNIIIKDDKEITNTINNLVKSGAVTVKQELVKTNLGTPQGGVVSPLLANIAFNGMETMIENWAWNNKERTGQRCKRDCPIQVIVYADDFVVIAKEKWIVTELKVTIEKWCMENMGVELSKEKTRITNIFKGFDFLGCNVRKYQSHSTKHTQQSRSNTQTQSRSNATHTHTLSKTLIKPSKDSIKSIKLKIKDTIKCAGKTSQEVLIGTLNPIIRGWANYHNGIVSKEIFSSIDKYIFERTWKWATKRHSNKGKTWIKDKYWHKVGNRNWVFKTENYTLMLMSDTKIMRHVKIKGRHHAFDGDNEYWFKHKMTKTKSKKTRKETCLVKQKFKCNWCQQTFKHDLIIELDHIVPKCCGGDEQSKNLQVLHRHCHDTKTKNDGTYDKERRKSKVKIEKDILKRSDWF